MNAMILFFCASENRLICPLRSPTLVIALRTMTRKNTAKNLSYPSRQRTDSLGENPFKVWAPIKHIMLNSNFSTYFFTGIAEVIQY